MFNIVAFSNLIVVAVLLFFDNFYYLPVCNIFNTLIYAILYKVLEKYKMFIIVSAVFYNFFSLVYLIHNYLYFLKIMVQCILILKKKNCYFDFIYYLLNLIICVVIFYFNNKSEYLIFIVLMFLSAVSAMIFYYQNQKNHAFISKLVYIIMVTATIQLDFWYNF